MGKTKLLDLGTLLEQDPSSPSQPKEFTWRRDPEESFSDWTIIVNQKAGVGCEAEVEPPATYHVHKIFLGAGPRSSDYFCNVFHNTELAESKTSTTVLELEASAAQAFPDMLDFIYNQKENPSSESAVPLRHLASYFCVPALFEHTNHFIQKDIKTSNIHVYLKEALLYHDDTMIRATMEAAANNWRFLVAPSTKRFAPTDTSASASSRYLALLPQEKQLEVTQLALQRAADEVASLYAFASRKG